MRENKASLDEMFPEYDVRMVEERVVRVPPAQVFDTFEQLRISDMPMARFLGKVRTLGQPDERAKERPLLVEELQHFGWVPLLREPGRELIAGLVGEVWRRDFGVARVADREAFLRFQEPGYAKIVVSYRFVAIPEGTRVISETRVLCTSPEAARRFRWYWRLIRLGARLTVRSGLSATKRVAEAA